MSKKDQTEFSFGSPSNEKPAVPEPKQKEAEVAAVAVKTKKAKSAPEPQGTPIPLQDGGPLQELMDYNFIQYASYVICERAIPQLYDGLKPVQRRILHSLKEKDDGRFVKVANIVGHTMQYHPHGDASIGDALVSLTNRRFLIEGQGNFGNIFTGDRAAAARYIECRLTKLAREEIYNKELTEFVPSYDGRNKEPVTLPSKLPLILMLGAEGIAVGLSTKILPHNFKELLEAQIAILQKKQFSILPDFQQGGLMDISDYDDGNGAIKVRAKIQEKKNNRIVITELPANTTSEALISSIEDSIRKKKIPVKAITDFTAEKVEIELTLTPGTKPEKAIKALYAFTTCESKISSNIILIRDGKPVEFTANEVIVELTKRLKQLLEAELNQRKHNLEEDVYTKTLVQIFIENRIYKDIEECKTSAAIEDAILDGFIPFKKKLSRKINDKDIETLLNVRIKRISRFDIDKNRKDIEKLQAEIAEIEKHLKQLTRYAVRYLKRIIKEYAEDYPRKTKVVKFDSIEVRELTAKELKIGYDIEKGYCGYSVAGEETLECSSYDKLIMVWDDGKYKVTAPPERIFVDTNMLYLAKVDRDKEFTLVYTLDHFTFIKRFTFGGTILDRDYLCTPEGAKVLLFQEGAPEELYVKYKPAKNQRIHQQVFRPLDTPVKGVKARGNHMTGKKIARIATSQQRWWKKDEDNHNGILL